MIATGLDLVLEVNYKTVSFPRMPDMHRMLLLIEIIESEHKGLNNPYIPMVCLVNTKKVNR